MTDRVPKNQVLEVPWPMEESEMHLGQVEQGFSLFLRNFWHRRARSTFEKSSKLPKKLLKNEKSLVPLALKFKA